MIRLAFAAALLIATPALAQQAPPDPAFLQKAAGALQAQRNTALDAQAVAEARAAMLADEVAALKKQVEDLKPKAEPPKP